MTSFKNVLLIGAGGDLGRPVLRAFLASTYNVTVLSRAESTSTFPDDVAVVKADYKSLASVTAAMRNQDVVISMVGGIAAGDQNIFIDAALAAGVQRFFPSEFGPYSRNKAFQEVNPWVLPHKAATVDYLRAHEGQMSWTSVVTGAFFDWAMETGFFGFDLKSKSVTLIDDGVSVFTSTRLEDIATALVAMLDRPEDTKNQYVFISSFHVSQIDILRAVERVDQKWHVKNVTSEEVIANGRRTLEGGDFTGIKDLTRGAAFGKQGLGDERARAGTWNEKLGLPKVDLDEAVKEVLMR